MPVENAPTESHRAARLRLAGFASLILLLFVVATVGGWLPNADEIRDWGESLGWVGPVVFIPAGAAMLCLFVPGPVMAGAAGLLFGTRRARESRSLRWCSAP